MFDESLDVLLSQNADPVAAGWQLRELAESATGRGQELLGSVADRAESLAWADPAIVGGLLRVLHTVLLQPGGNQPSGEPLPLGETVAKAGGRDSRSDSGNGTPESSVMTCDFDQLASIHDALRPNTPNRYLMLHLMAMLQSEVALAGLVERLDQQPPEKWVEGAQVISPLMQRNQWPVDAFYPAALSLIGHASLAAPILDLANYLFRENRVTTHPAIERIALLNSLLGEVAGRLARFEENPRTFGDDVDTVGARLGEAVSLAVSLCDTVGMIGDETSIGKLNQAIDLKHRRVQCEVAGALARLGQASGRERLLELVKDPAARLRAIHYADELNVGHAIDEKFRSDEATAESEVSLWLSQPQQMGVPPTGVEVVDSKRMLWPSFQDPIDVFLVRFEYNFGDRIYSNVAVAGPVTFAMSADVADFSMSDIYAIYAGWHVEHPEIFSVAAEHLNDAQIRLMKTLEKHLDHLGYESIKPCLLGVFLDEKAGVFLAIRDGKQCAVATDGLETIDHPVSGRLRPITPGDLFNLYKGRKMLRTFNPLDS